MKLNLPKNARVRDCRYTIALPVASVRIPRMLGWDIANEIAKLNSISIRDLVEKADMRIYSREIMIDLNWMPNSLVV